MAEALDKVKGSLVSGYAAKSGRTPEEVSALMAAETWFDASDAVAQGFADRLIEPVRIAATFDIGRFRNAPPVLVEAIEAEPEPDSESDGGDIEADEDTEAAAEGDEVADAEDASSAASDAPEPPAGTPPPSGAPPDPSNIPSGCSFRERCPLADARCAAETPILTLVSLGGHSVACQYRDDLDRLATLAMAGGGKPRPA